MQHEGTFMTLTGQVGIVTGGGRGIGQTVAVKLAHAGMSVAVIARSANELDATVDLVKISGGNARAFPADVTDRETVHETVREIEKSMGPVGLLVNNAGAVGPLGPIWETDVDKWWQGMEVNLYGALLCSHAVLPWMIARRHGTIINVASGAGTGAVPLAYFSSYVTSKTALIRFTECLAAETKGQGIAVFAISPGTVRTAMSESIYSPEGQKWLPWFRSTFDEGRDVPAERPARLILDLASGKANLLSGRFLSINDDLDDLINRASELEKNSHYMLRLQKPAK
jgi:NAD(P)-dependent dehydrogenase (short-subunit alcohol dehydrogenase family)